MNQGAESIEEPAMTVELLLILLLEAEQDLDRTGSSGHLAIFGHHNVRGVPLDEVRITTKCLHDTKDGLTRKYGQ